MGTIRSSSIGLGEYSRPRELEALALESVRVGEDREGVKGQVGVEVRAGLWM